MKPKNPFARLNLLISLIILIAHGCQEQDTTFPDYDYPNAHLLVSPESLEARLHQSDVAIVDTRTTGYDAAHIPGAINLKWSDFLDQDKNLKSIELLEADLSKAGLHRDMTIILYDRTRTSWGAVGRMFWMLEYLGCNDVHILNGGLDFWIQSGRDTESEPSTLPPAVFTASTQNTLLATKQHLNNRMKDSDFVIIDARTDEEYNGWQMYGEARGGHISGAVQIPFERFFSTQNDMLLDRNEIESILHSQGITTDKEVTTYCTAGIRSGYVYFILRLMGYSRCSNYDGSILEWAEDQTLPMSKLKRYEKLVNPAWVMDLIEGKNPATYPGKGYVIVEARYLKSTTTGDSADPADEECIPGALRVHPCYFEHENDTSKYYPNYTHPDDGNLLPADRLESALLNLGITKDTTVVVYGNGVIIPMTASRVAWALMYAGVEDVRILNGGYTAWLAAGGPVSPSPAKPVPASDFGTAVPAHPEYLATTELVEEISKNGVGPSVLTDVRLISEYIGEDVDHYPFFKTTGHIPNAVWFGDWVELIDLHDSTFRSYTQVENHLKSLGIHKQVEPIFYCGTGWRSSIGFFQAYIMGFENMRNYDGSFYEWSFDPKRPISTESPD